MTGTTLHIPTLETERLILRGPRRRDVDGFVEFFASDRAKYAGGSADTSKAWSEFAEMIGHWTLRGFGSYIITRKYSDRGIGHVGGLHPPNWPEREIGWSLWRAHDEGRGYATEAASAVIRHVYETLGWATAVSYIAPDNVASIAMAERLGATRDKSARTPTGLRCFVYRHPAPEALH